MVKLVRAEETQRKLKETVGKLENSFLSTGNWRMAFANSGVRPAPSENLTFTGGCSNLRQLANDSP